MNDRDLILARVRRAVRHRAAPPPPHPAPALPGDWACFAAALEAVGGEPLGPVPAARAAATLEEALARWADHGRVVAEPSAAALLGDGPWERAEPHARPAGFADVEVAVVRGELGVAENAAVAVPAGDLPHRSLLFLCQRLVLLVPDIVPDLHTAAARLAPRVREEPHLTWVSGPSKTADIEQALVYGAHGAVAMAAIGLGG